MVFLQCFGYMAVFLVCPGQIQKFQDLLDQMVNNLKPLFPNRVLGTVWITRKILEALGQMSMFLEHPGQAGKVSETISQIVTLSNPISQMKKILDSQW